VPLCFRRTSPALSFAGPETHPHLVHTLRFSGAFWGT
jgi:hypothetical protein